MYYNLGTPPSLYDVGDEYEWIDSGIPAGDYVEVNFNMINNVVEGWNTYFQVDSDDDIIELNEGNNIWGPDVITWNPLPAISPTFNT